MIEIQCTSCHTRYRIDERVLPDDTPTFKCSRCGHVFNADPVAAKVRKPAPQADDSESQPPRTIRPARARAGALKSPVESDVVRREPVAEPEPSFPQRPEPRVQKSEPVRRESVAPRIPDAPAAEPAKPQEKDPRAPDPDDPLNRSFGDREPKADTGENLRFDFSDEHHEMSAAPAERELERPEPDDGGWQVGDAPNEFQAAPIGPAPSMRPEPAAASRPVRRMASTLSAEAPRFAPPPPSPGAAGFQLGQAEDDAAESESPGATHASGLFLAMFFFVAIVFLGASALICGEPAASARILGQAPRIGDYFARPIVPAMLVALHDVRSEYYTLKGGHVALVITGVAQNVGTHPLHLVEIDAVLLGDDANLLANQSVFCGNELSAKMLGEMTPREIEFSQGLSPQKAFAMNPAGSAPFLMIFVDPPTGAGKIRISVTKAVATPPDSRAAYPPPA